MLKDDFFSFSCIFNTTLKKLNFIVQYATVS